MKDLGYCKLKLVDSTGKFLIFKETDQNLIPESCGKKGMFFIQYACQLDQSKW
jgi:hypothetical protein